MADGTVALPSASASTDPLRTQPGNEHLQFGMSPATLRGLTKIALFFLLICQLGVCACSFRRSLSGYVDFRAFYTAGHIVASGHGSKLYQYAYIKSAERSLVADRGQTLPFLYPAYTALLFVPLSLFSYRTAFVLFTLLNILLLSGWVCWFVSRQQMHSGISRLLSVAAAFSFMPVAIALTQGQISILLLCCYSAVYGFLESRRPFLAGCALACALAKFQIALPIVLLMLCWRKWRFVNGFLSGALVTGIISFLVAGVSGNKDYFHTIASVASKTASDAAAAKAVYGMYASDMPNLHGFFFVLSHASSSGIWMTACVSAVLLFWAALRRPSFLTALVVAMLVSYHMQEYDFVLLLLPLAVCLNYLLLLRSSSRGSLNMSIEPAYRMQLLAGSLGLVVILLTFPASALIYLYAHAWICVLAPAAILFSLLLISSIEQELVREATNAVDGAFA